jgi:hypothetical protein
MFHDCTGHLRAHIFCQNLPRTPAVLPFFTATPSQDFAVLGRLTSLQRLEMFHDCPGHLDGSLQHHGPYALTPEATADVSRQAKGFFVCFGGGVIGA